jgi:hypothetical protein
VISFGLDRAKSLATGSRSKTPESFYWGLWRPRWAKSDRSSGRVTSSSRAWSWATLMHRAIRHRRPGVCPLWRPPTPDRHAARSRGHPEDPRAPRPLAFGTESRPRPTRVRRRRVLIGRFVWHSMPLTLAGSLDPQGGRSCALWQRLLERPASESGTLCQRDTSPRARVTAAGGRSCCLSSRRCPQSFLSDRPAAALGTAGTIDLWRMPLAHRILVSSVLTG